MQDLSETLNSHNLNRVIAALERNTPQQEVYLWPTARNNFIYSPRKPIAFYPACCSDIKI